MLEIHYLAVVGRHAVKTDDSCRPFHAIMTPGNHDALVDRSVLAQVDLPGLVAGEDGVDLEAACENEAFVRVSRGGRAPRGLAKDVDGSGGATTTPTAAPTISKWRPIRCTPFPTAGSATSGCCAWRAILHVADLQSSS